MAKFVDVYLLPIAEAKLAAYKKMASTAGKVFMKHGAVSYREYVLADNGSEHGTVPFPKMAKAKPGEIVIYAAVEFKSRTHRDKVMKAAMDDTALAAMMSQEPIFNYKRMAYSGFTLLVDAK